MNFSARGAGAGTFGGEGPSGPFFLASIKGLARACCNFGFSPKIGIAEIQEKINYPIRYVGLEATQLAQEPGL
jgi:hypothetical protein